MYKGWYPINYFKHILLFNKKQLDRTQVSQLRNVFSINCFNPATYVCLSQDLDFNIICRGVFLCPVSEGER